MSCGHTHKKGRQFEVKVITKKTKSLVLFSCLDNHKGDILIMNKTCPPEIKRTK